MEIKKISRCQILSEAHKNQGRKNKKKMNEKRTSEKRSNEKKESVYQQENKDRLWIIFIFTNLQCLD